MAVWNKPVWHLSKRVFAAAYTCQRVSMPHLNRGRPAARHPIRALSPLNNCLSPQEGKQPRIPPYSTGREAPALVFAMPVESKRLRREFGEHFRFIHLGVKMTGAGLLRRLEDVD